jgi:hypothetical protein
MTTKGRRRPAVAKDDAPPVDPRFVPVVKAFAKDRRVTSGGKSFGSSGLKVDGKLFAMISSRGLFVVKLPRKRVDQLVQLGSGRPFDPGHGRLMKEWVELDGAEASWIGLAREARAFVGAAKSK